MLRRLFRSPAFGYLLALVGISSAVGITLLIAQFTKPGPAIGFLYLIAILAAAWTGYGPGVLACVLTFVVAPYTLVPHFALSRIDVSRLILTVITSGLMSSLAAGRRHVEERLNKLNHELEIGIRKRT